MSAPADVLGAFLHHSRDVLSWELDLQGRIRACNAAAEALLTGPERIGALLVEAIHESCRSTYSALLAGRQRSAWLTFLLPDGGLQPASCRSFRKDEAHFLFAVCPGKPGRQLPELATANRELVTLTETLRRKNRRLEQLGQELARSNRELSVFADVVAHDLLEPLASLSGHAQLLARLMGDDLSSDSRACVDQILAGAERMRQLVRDVLDFSRVHHQPGQLTPVDLRALLAEVLSDLRSLLRKSGTQVCCGLLPMVLADRTLLRLVLQNLIANAVKHARGAAVHVEIWAQRENGCWTVNVRDNGPGLPAEQAERVFEMFLSGAGGGTGMGLAICHKIIQRHGGRIWCESAPDQGATFRFTLPVRSEQSSAQTQARSA